MTIRSATNTDYDAIWSILEPTLREGETYTLPVNMTREQSLQYWFSPNHSVFIYEDGDQLLGTYYMKANQQGHGAHVANCGFMTLPAARGRGIAREMCLHALSKAKEFSFMAMRFNFIVSTNTHALNLWTSLGFEIVGKLPSAFHHPRLGYVDAYVMFKWLQPVPTIYDAAEKRGAQ